jgi:hypothetical protein
MKGETVIDRQNLEFRANWIATFEQTKGNSFICLMQGRSGTYYWHLPDYQGLFPSGATAGFYHFNFWDAMHKGYLKLVSGVIPDDIKRWEIVKPGKESS